MRQTMMVLMKMLVVLTVSRAAARPSGQRNHTTRPEPVFPGETVPLQLDHGFPAVGPVRPLHMISISPWTYNVSSEDELYPQQLSQAQCSLQGCLVGGVEDRSLQSRPIMHEVLVLRRVRPSTQSSAQGSTQGSTQSSAESSTHCSTQGSTQSSTPGYQFRLERRLVAVGCTCVRPSFRVQH
ncbi:interleukin 17a/f1 [Salarias fasciatus]|uniref:interleukin 17a/f1 n=1 Tax=Salarias fasciatus TaxID=181472 RepID=UPI001176BA31|nr:interleukin-17F-like [Salarias fasciatus]